MIIKKFLLPIYNQKIKGQFTKKNSTSWLLMQQVIIAPMSFLSNMLLLNILSKGDAAIYYYIISISGMVTIASMNGFSDVASFNIQRGKHEFYLIAFKYKKILRWFPSIILFMLSLYYYFYLENINIAILFIINIVLHFFADIYNVFPLGCLAMGDYKLKAILEILIYFVSYFPPILIAYIYRKDSFVLAYLFLCMYILQLIFKYLAFQYVKTKYNYKQFKNLKQYEKEYDGNYQKESISYSLNSIISTINNNFSTIVIYNTIDKEGTAIYNLSITFANFAQGFISAPITKLFYNLSKMSENKISNLNKANFVKNTFFYYFKITIPIMILSMIAMPFVYYYLYNQYYDSYPYAILYFLSLISLIFAPSIQFYIEKRKFKLTNTVQTIIVILNVILLFLTSKEFGIIGAIVTSILIKILNNLIFTYLLYLEK